MEQINNIDGSQTSNHRNKISKERQSGFVLGFFAVVVGGWGVGGQ